MDQLKIFVELSRLNKPIGFMLLFWPCSWGLAYAYYFNQNGKAKDNERAYEAYADQNWSPVAYAKWLVDYSNAHGLNQDLNEFLNLSELVSNLEPDFEKTSKFPAGRPAVVPTPLPLMSLSPPRNLNHPPKIAILRCGENPGIGEKHLIH